MHIFSNEIVFRGHPDKICDQIGDAILDEYLKQDKNTRAGIEVTAGKGHIFITGEVTTAAQDINIENITKQVLKDIGCSDDINIINNIGQQSPDIALGVDIGGAGDQGMMFGYACNDNETLLPDAMVILQDISRQYYRLTQRYPGVFLPDGKAMLTGIYQDRELVGIKSMLISYQVTQENRIKYNTDVKIKKMITKALSYRGHYIALEDIMINPTGKFEIGGFEGDAGVLGRKIVVDGYHGFYHVGGGAQSGKDGTKVDRSGMYKARQIAKQYVRQFNLQWCEVQLSYAIGKCEPMSIYINTDKGVMAAPESLYKECEPQNIIADLDLLSPQFYQTAQYGHVGGNFIWEK